MKRRTRLVFPILILLLCNFVIGAAVAQNPQLQQRVADIKEAAVRNRQALAEYTWVEQVTISLKGEEKKQEHFQVRLGADGKQQKTSLDPPPSPPSADSGDGRRGGRLKQHVVEKKKEEYKDYADQIRALIQQYVPPEKEMLEQAYQKGNVKLSEEAGSPGQYRLVISNYVKNGDSMALIVNQAQRDLAGISINSYLDDPKNAVTVNVQFSAMPGGPNHVSTETINGVSKQLTINIQNSNYQRL